MKPKYPLVLVEWEDSCSPTMKTWYHPDELKDYSPAGIVTIGFLLHDKPSHITLVSGYGVIGNDDDVQKPFAIPRGCVKRIKKLKV